MKHLGVLKNYDFAPELKYLDYNDTEEYIESELHQNELLEHFADATTVDLSNARCWSHQQAFVRHVLPWFPLFSQDDAVRHVNSAQEVQFDANSSSTPIALYILALGAFSKAELITGNDPREFPGLNYFAAARKISGPDGLTHAIHTIQGQILRT